MDKFYIVFSVIIAMCALLSPAVVALVNNRHQLKLRKLEIEEQQKLHSQEVIDGFFRSAGVCSRVLNTASLSEYGQYSSLIYFYLPSEFHPDITAINNAANHHSNSENVSKALEPLALKYSEKCGQYR